MSSTANTNPINESEILQVPNALLGIDVSHYQGDIQWDLVVEAGVKFAWIKATDGTATDPMLKANAMGAAALRLPVGFYHFWRPGIPMIAQADAFMGQVSEITEPWEGRYLDAIDIEVGSLTEDAQDLALGFLQLLSDPLKQYPPPLVYCSPGYAAQNLTDPAWLGYPLWVAHYTDQLQPNIGKWPKWTFWQRQARARIPGILSDVDIDWYNGSAEDFQAMLALPSAVDRTGP